MQVGASNLKKIKPDNLKRWEHLPKTYQTANIKQAAYSIRILETAGFGVRKSEGAPVIFDGFTEKEIEFMAELEHGRWNIERFRAISPRRVFTVLGWRARRLSGHPADAALEFGPVTQAFMKDETVARITISLPASLLGQLDEVFERKGRGNRSQAMADIIRDFLVEESRKAGTEEIAGTITLVYDHHKQHVQAALTDIQHDHHDAIISTLHVHLDHHNCMEVLAVRGKANEIQKIADELIAAKGVKHGKLTVTTTGKGMPS